MAKENNSKKILLISNRVMHYRSRIYNRFFHFFKEMGYEFHVISNEYQKVDFPIEYERHQLPFGFKAYRNFIRELQPTICINFLHLKDKLIIPLTLYCRFRKIPMIYWNHGINIKTPKAKFKNMIFRLIHTISSAIILYSPAQLQYISEKNRKKTFIAKNTLDFSDVNLKSLRSPAEVKRMYGIKEKKVILYISRILPYKELDILLSLFPNEVGVALVVVGEGASAQQKALMKKTDNFYYLGEKYGNDVNEIYQIGDVFSTPGHIGLALNQAMFWGLPVVVLDRIHAPEIINLKNGFNGWIVGSEHELKEKIIDLLRDEELLAKMSAHARKTFESEMQISDMFRGFKEAVQFVQ